MTDEAVMDTAAAPATPAPETTSTPDVQVSEVSETNNEGGERASLSEGGESSDFALPDEYKESKWAQKVKSQDDLFKLIENQDALIGKKTIKPIDYETATPEQITEYHKSLAPEDATGYQWAEDSMTDFTEPMSNAFIEAGINPYQQKLITAKFDEIVGKISGDQTAVDTSEEVYMGMMKESFGDDYQKSVGIVEGALKQFSSDDDKKIFDAVDNTTRAAVDRTTHSLVEFYEGKISDFKKEYGVVESGSQVDGNLGSNSGTSPAEKRSEIRAQMREVDGTPNGHIKKAELQAQLNKLL